MSDKQQELIAQLKTRNIVVLGAGLTGLSCVRFLTDNQLCCRVNDNRPNIIDETWFEQQYSTCQLVQGEWQHQWLKEADVILVSPGIDVVVEQLDQHIRPSVWLLAMLKCFVAYGIYPLLQ